MTEHDRTEQPIGATLDQMGVRAELGPADIVIDVVVILKVVNTDCKGATLVLAGPEEQDWIQQEGLLSAARRQDLTDDYPD